MRLRELLFCGFLLPFLALAGCGSGELARPDSEVAYFDVPGFMQQQLGNLTKQQPVLEKTVWVNQQKPEMQRLQQVNWEEELQHFLEIDLNKKGLQGVYTVSEEDIAGGKLLKYTRVPDETAPIKFLEITIGAGQAVKQLRAVAEEKNALFYSREERIMTVGGNQKIQAYRVSGVQKVFLFDSLHYTAKASLIHSK